jgi:DnaJ family protein C protein 8
VFKAESELGDTVKREDLDAAINQARSTLLKELSLPTSTPDDHPKLEGLTPPFKAQLRQKSKELLIEEELRRRRCVYCRHDDMADLDKTLDRRAIKLNLANEGFEARKKEEEAATKKRKAEDDVKWEGNVFTFHARPMADSHTCSTASREQRVDSWRSFANTSKKKKKQKADVLG